MLQIVFPPQVIFAFIRFVLNVPGIKRIKETCKPVSFATGNQHAYLASLDLCTQDVGFWHLSCYNFRFLNFREVFFDGTWNTFLVRYKVAWYLRESRHGRENQTCRKSCIFLPCHPSYLRFHSIIANVDFFEVFFGVDLDFFWAATRTDHIYHHPSPPLSLSLAPLPPSQKPSPLPPFFPPSFLPRSIKASYFPRETMTVMNFPRRERISDSRGGIALPQSGILKINSLHRRAQSAIFSQA